MIPNLKKTYNTFPLKDRIPYNQFREVVNKVMKDIGQRVLDGDRVQTPLGTIRIMQQERDFNKPVINWQASNKYKKELLSQGKIPRDGDNGGEPWLIYHTDDKFYHWNIGNNTTVMINDNRYKLVMVKQMKKQLSENLSDVLKRTRYEEN